MGLERKDFFAELPQHLTYEPHDVVKIGDRLVGKGQPTFIIAELGGNHGKDIEIALSAINAAAAAGCDAIKFQHLTGTKIAADTPIYDSWHGDPIGPLSSFYGKAEMPYEWTDRLIARAQEKGIMFLSTPFDVEAVDLLDQAGVAAFKVASYELTDDQLLRYMARKGRPMIISTGMAYLEEVAHAVRVIQEEGNDQIVILHCVSMYPPKSYHDLNLQAITTMREAFHLPIGYSDHSPPPLMAAPVAAVTLGACAIEKHFTLVEAGKTNDSPNSLSPEQLAIMVQEIRAAEAALSGSGIKQPVSRGSHEGDDGDEVNDRFARRSVYAVRDLKVGEVLTEDMITTLRPWAKDGVTPSELPLFLGTKLIADVPARGALTHAHFLQR